MALYVGLWDCTLVEGFYASRATSQPFNPSQYLKISRTPVPTQEHLQADFLVPGWMETPVHVCLLPDNYKESSLLHQIGGYSSFHLAGKTELRQTEMVENKYSYQPIINSSVP